ncbi:S41 family peptidase [Nonomuraea sp. NPDC050202]|uniref:S41 family peptidase n=1 Tax=Nonomuraea sp. NPDC050202 TaxID=3155035 RepID=UPI0033DBD757
MTAVTTGARIALLLAALLMTACTAPAPPRGETSTATGTVCAPPRGTPGKETATTIDVIEQAYFCILGHYYGGATLDARPLLTAGFAAMTQELNRNGRDLPEAAAPALNGDRKADWAAFETAYRKITDQVPGLRDDLAVATLEAIVAALDHHASWAHDAEQPPDYHDGDGYGLGLEANVSASQADGDLDAAVPPLFVTTVRGGAARAAGLRPGDVIESINGSAPFTGPKATPAIAALYQRYPQARPVRLRLLRQSTGRRWSVTLQPGLYQQDLAALQVVRSKLLGDDLAYVRVTGFLPDSADRILRAITRLRQNRTLSGVVLDLRGNSGNSDGSSGGSGGSGGSITEATRLLSAFAHGKITAYHCTAGDTCTSLRTDDTVALLGLPLVVLTDRGCASACEHFSSAVKDLRAGLLVGTRTAGLISGPAQPYLLANNTILRLPAGHHLGPDREVIDRIGVPPDHHVPLTPADAAAGRDPALAKALTLLHE